MAVTQSWFLLGWATAVFIFFYIQREAPGWFTDQSARYVFGVSVSTQCALSILLAMITQWVGAYFIATGMIANTIAITVNGFRMPILNASGSNACYIKANEYTRALWLCDIFETTETSRAKWIVSLGDALECIGIWVFTAEILFQYMNRIGVL